MQIAVQHETDALIVLATGGYDGPGNFKRTPGQSIETRKFIDGSTPEQIPRQQFTSSATFVVNTDHADFAAAEAHALQHEQLFHGKTFTAYFWHAHTATPGTDPADLHAEDCTVTVTNIRLEGLLTITTYRIKGGPIEDLI